MSGNLLNLYSMHNAQTFRFHKIIGHGRRIYSPCPTYDLYKEYLGISFADSSGFMSLFPNRICLRTHSALF